ncbi:MAG: hypothetical protein ABIC68_06355 [Candidatus Omnitrophota bacterium]
MQCKNHPEREALYFCTVCANYLCFECVKMKRFSDEAVFYICPHCQGKCLTLEEIAFQQEEKTSQDTFWVELSRIFVFPFKGKGKQVILTGGLYFGFLFFVLGGSRMFSSSSCCTVDTSIFPVSPLIIFLIPVLGLSCFLVLMYLSRIVSWTALGKDEPPQWGSQEFWLASMRRSTWLAVAAIFILYLCLRVFLKNMEYGINLFFLPVVAGLFIFPAVFIKIALEDDFFCFHTREFFSTIKKYFKAYCVAVALFFLFLFVSCRLIMVILLHPSIIFAAQSSFLILPIVFYLLLVKMRVLGLLARKLHG